MGLLASILSPLAANGVNPEIISDVAVSLVANGSVTKADLGAAILGGFQVASGTNAPATTAAPAAVTPAISPREALDRIYGAYDNHRRRSVGALMNITGLPEQAVLALVSGNADFRVSRGRRSGKTFVSVRS